MAGINLLVYLVQDTVQFKIRHSSQQVSLSRKTRLPQYPLLFSACSSFVVQIYITTSSLHWAVLFMSSGNRSSNDDSLEPRAVSTRIIAVRGKASRKSKILLWRISRDCSQRCCLDHETNHNWPSLSLQSFLFFYKL